MIPEDDDDCGYGKETDGSDMHDLSPKSLDTFLTVSRDLRDQKLSVIMSAGGESDESEQESNFGGDNNPPGFNLEEPEDTLKIGKETSKKKLTEK